jgi:hypothetical protein
MRDFENIEELNSTAALGLWADDVVLALDQARSDSELSQSGERLLQEAAEILRATARRTEQPFTTPRSARDLAATDSTLMAIATMAPETSNVSERLDSMAQILGRAASKQLTPEDTGPIQTVMNLFARLGEQQLVASNSMLLSQKEGRGWLGALTTSTSY